MRRTCNASRAATRRAVATDGGIVEGGCRDGPVPVAAPRPSHTTTGGGPMAELDTQDRDKLRSTQFAYVDKDGGEHLPINDASHVRNAMARFNQTDFESQTAREEARRKILAAAKRYDIEVDEDSNVAQSSR